MTGILAIWNDCAPEGYAHFERWYNARAPAGAGRRAGLPLRPPLRAAGRRRPALLRLLRGGAAPTVLSSPAYVERLENPTPWTTESMKCFRDMVRTVCDLRAAAGDLIGSHAVVLRADEAMAPTPDGEKLVAQARGRARHRARAAVDRGRQADPRRHGGDEEPGQGPAGRRRLRRRVRAPRRRRSRRRACWRSRRRRSASAGERGRRLLFVVHLRQSWSCERKRIRANRL